MGSHIIQLQQLQIEIENNTRTIINSGLITNDGSLSMNNTDEIENNNNEKIISQIEIDREYKNQLRTLNKGSCCDFFFILVPSIIIGAIILGFPWFKVSYKDELGYEICSKNIYVTMPYINIEYNKQLESEYINQQREKTVSFLCAGLVYSILVFIDSIFLLPVFYFKNKRSLIFEVVYYLLEFFFVISIITQYKQFLFFPQHYKVNGCVFRNNSMSKIELYVSFYVLSIRVMIIKSIRIILCFRCVIKAKKIKNQKILQEDLNLKRKASTLNLTVHS
ncbi:hypothetical protein RB653_003379 [Dictyostelium firmibasis]|uniref:Transmembrane protein n=1 Tax=Dictyostelium firmibasis TaxID=79012 RepID=A0AAN7U5Q2_9MYCE